jgi:hypothetical protein
MTTTARDRCGEARHDDPQGLPFSTLARHTGVVAVEQLEMICTDPGRLTVGSTRPARRPRAHQMTARAH